MEEFNDYLHKIKDMPVIKVFKKKDNKETENINEFKIGKISNAQAN